MCFPLPFVDADLATTIFNVVYCFAGMLLVMWALKPRRLIFR